MMVSKDDELVKLLSKIDITSDEQDIQDMILNFAILPRVLPQEKSTKLHQIELDLVAQMIKNVMNLSGILPIKTIELFEKLKKIHGHTVPNEDDITDQIKSLRSGDTFAIFVRRQNTTFIVYAPPNQNPDGKEPEDVIVATFPGNLHPTEVYKHESDMEVNF